MRLFPGFIRWPRLLSHVSGSVLRERLWVVHALTAIHKAFMQDLCMASDLWALRPLDVESHSADDIHHLWLNLPEVQDVDKVCFLDAHISQDDLPHVQSVLNCLKTFRCNTAVPQIFSLWSDLAFLQVRLPLEQESRLVDITTNASSMGCRAVRPAPVSTDASG